MVKFKINDDTRRLIKKHYQRVNATVTFIGNKRMGSDPGLFPASGGVVINGKFIRIADNEIVDTSTPKLPVQLDTKEEWIAAAALHDTIAILKKDPDKLVDPLADILVDA